MRDRLSVLYNIYGMENGHYVAHKIDAWKRIYQLNKNDKVNVIKFGLIVLCAIISSAVVIWYF